MELAFIHASNVGKALGELQLGIYASDIEVQFPFAPEGHTNLLEGIDALTRFLTAIGEFTEGHRIEAMSVTKTETGFLLEYTEFSTFKSTGLPYSSEIFWIASVKDGLITHMRELYNPVAVLAALGELSGS